MRLIRVLLKDYSLDTSHNLTPTHSNYSLIVIPLKFIPTATADRVAAYNIKIPSAFTVPAFNVSNVRLTNPVPKFASKKIASPLLLNAVRTLDCEFSGSVAFEVEACGKIFSTKVNPAS